MTNQNGSTEATSGPNLDEKIGSLKEKARDIVDQGSEKVDQLKARASQVRDQAMARGNAFLDRVTELIKANPLKAVGVAFAAGYFGMRLFRR